MKKQEEGIVNILIILFSWLLLLKR